jgi:hypothetical protein
MYLHFIEREMRTANSKDILLFFTILFGIFLILSILKAFHLYEGLDNADPTKNVTAAVKEAAPALQTAAMAAFPHLQEAIKLALPDLKKAAIAASPSLQQAAQKASPDLNQAAQKTSNQIQTALKK